MVVFKWLRAHLRLLLLSAAVGTGLTVAANPALTGTWSGTAEGQTLTVTFDGKGGGTSNGQRIRYQVQGSLLLVEEDGEVASYEFDIRGNKLIVAGGVFMHPVTLLRGTAPGNPAKRATPAGDASAGVAAMMVGKWCEVSSFSANAGGGSQSATCFELRADGSYHYQAESSRSAYGGGMWGGTASSTNDSGRWSSNDRTLTAHSQSGQVHHYQLERRNHPRNRDPMLCLDGTCYVSYWQKAPW